MLSIAGSGYCIAHSAFVKNLKLKKYIIINYMFIKKLKENILNHFIKIYMKYIYLKLLFEILGFGYLLTIPSKFVIYFKPKKNIIFFKKKR